MTDILIRNVDGKTVARLKSKAKRSGRSLQGEVLQILRQAAGDSIAQVVATGKKWRASQTRKFSDSTALLREDRAR